MATIDVAGVDLREGDVLVEHLPGGASALHLIDHFADYPGTFSGAGDHARRAYDPGGRWCATVADRETFHILTQEGTQG
jgi:hypothetical protein